MRQTEMFLGSSVLSKQKQKESDLKVSHLYVTFSPHRVDTIIRLPSHFVKKPVTVSNTSYLTDREFVEC